MKASRLYISRTESWENICFGSGEWYNTATRKGEPLNGGMVIGTTQLVDQMYQKLYGGKEGKDMCGLGFWTPEERPGRLWHAHAAPSTEVVSSWD